MEKPELPHDQRQEGAGDGGKCAEDEPSAPQSGDLSQVGLGGGELPQHFPGVADQHLARIGRRHPAGMPAHQRLPHLTLQAA